MLFAFFFGFLSGAVAIVAAEALGLVYFIRLLKRRQEVMVAPEHIFQSDNALDSQQSIHFAYEKKGIVWVLDSDRIPKETKKKDEIFGVSPVRKHARIKDRSLIFTEADGSWIHFPLNGCIVSAVSATNISLRKWAKKYPIKVEKKSSVPSNGRKTLYIYLKTSWEKESWCKALRLASFDDKERIEGFVKLNGEFHNYLTSLNAAYPFFIKPFTGFRAEPMETVNKVDGSSSKVRHFWKKLSKKVCKPGQDNKLTWNSLSVFDERKMKERPRSLQDFISNGGLTKATIRDKTSAEDGMALPSSSSSSTLLHAGSLNNSSFVSDIEADDKGYFDEGTHCWNLLISRLFFDAKCSKDVINSWQARIQRTLSLMRIPTYIGDVNCTGVHIGNIPPYIHNMRVLPMDINEVWAFESDIEYSGGASLDIETRLQVRELDFQKSTMNTYSGSDVTTGLLEEFENLEEQLLSQVPADTPEPRDEIGHIQVESNGSQNTPASNHVPRWKSILNSLAKQVSEMPLSMKIKVASLRGTIRLHIKPPPSDQLWFGFTSMPDIDLRLESSVGDCKITSGQISVLLINRFKAAIRDSIVLPNCEYVSIPWMLGEKNNWVPRNLAPFMWLNQEGTSDSPPKVPPNSHPFESKPCNEPKPYRETTCIEPEPIRKADGSVPYIIKPVSASSSSEDLKHPLFEGGEDSKRSSGSESFREGSNSKSIVDEDEAKQKRMGRKARMFDLGKKMGEKLEEKRRNIEEKGKHIVEKMRGPGT